MTEPQTSKPRRIHRAKGAPAKVQANRGPAADPSKPLAAANRELFSQYVARGDKLQDAYRLAGYRGNPRSQRHLRAQPDVSNRISWLLNKRIEDDTAARHKRERRVPQRQERVLREFERLAFSDIRDLIQWDKRPMLDEDGQVTGFQDELVMRPSRLLTGDQAAAVRSVSMRNGSVRLNPHDKLGALRELAKLLNMFPKDEPAPVLQAVTVNQVNVGETPALEAARRLAFALAKLGQQAPLVIDHAPDAGQKR